MKINKLKIFVIGIILIIGISIANFSSAAEVPQNFNVFDGQEGIKHHRFYPHYINGQVFYCINKGGSYNATLSETQYINYTPGNGFPNQVKEPDKPGKTNKVCEEKTHSAPWSGNLRYMHYELKEKIDEHLHQDEAYNLANAFTKYTLKNDEFEKTALLLSDLPEEEIWHTAYASWASSVSIPRQEYAQGDEGKAFKDFYEEIHKGKADIFASLLKDNTDKNKVKVMVDQENDIYTVGPFNISYPSKQYKEKNLFSWINNIKAITKTKEGKTLHEINCKVLDESGKEITGYGKDGSKTLNNTEFYLQFESTEATNVNFKINFGYLESCSAEMYKYEGKYFYREWEEEYSKNKDHDHNCDCQLKEGETCKTEHDDRYKWYKLKETEGSNTQTLMAFTQNASKNYKKASLIIGPSGGYDLTMKIEGDVFLDKATGKINTENNTFDKEDGEALPGVEVTLYEVDDKGNANIAKEVTVIPHIHNEDKENGGCYTGVKHIHSGSKTKGGGCYTKLVSEHEHKDNEYSGGECYEPIRHMHDTDCSVINCTKSHKHDNSCYQLKCSMKEHKHKSACRGYTCGSEEGHKHTEECYELKCETNHVHDDMCKKELICTQLEDHTHDKTCRGYVCGEEEHSHNYNLNDPKTCVKIDCDYYSGQILKYKLKCDKETEYALECGKTENDIDHYVLTCDKTIESTTTSPAIKLTDNNGHYTFTGLNSQKKYYVQFTYNGMVYTNVLYDSTNSADGSKATEEGQGHGPKKVGEVVLDEGNRQNFNNVFAEIGAYPANYEVKNTIFNVQSGIYTKIDKADGIHYYNKTYKQEEIIDLFKEISAEIVSNGGLEAEAYQTVYALHTQHKELYSLNGHSEEDTEIAKKIQFIADCRIKAYTEKKYPLTNKFVIDSSSKKVGDTTYEAIYCKTNEGKHIHDEDKYNKYNQLHVNLGIKARPTFDIAMYKDVLKAEVKINGKTETYNYDSRKQSGGFQLGIPEKYYLFGYGELSGMNKAYQAVKQESDGDDWTANWVNSARIQATTHTVDNNEITGIDIKEDTNVKSESAEYNLYMRSEEIANGQSKDSEGNAKYNGQQGYKVNDNYGIEEKIEERNGLKGDDRLQIFVTYKLSIANQSSTIGAVTEIVDYYDTNYEFINAYVGNSKGEKTGNVEGIIQKEDGKIDIDYNEINNSKYGETTEYKSAKYKTIYLRPDEKRLENNEKQYIYVVLQLVGPNGDAGTLLSGELFKENGTLEEMNIAEINGYKTYNSQNSEDKTTPGLIDIDSTPGDLNISNIDKLTDANIMNYTGIADMYEDDTSRAPAMIYRLTDSRTVEGVVFEDSTTLNKDNERTGNGTLDEGETGINGVKVELIEIKNGQMIVRATTETKNYNDKDGWYGFTGFVPGDYTIRYTYGADEKTAMIKDVSLVTGGLNGKSYNGQDYQATTYADKTEEYWYKVEEDNNNNIRNSDANDDTDRRNEIVSYSKKTDEVEIVNHKAEVFNSYLGKEQQPDHIKNTEGKIEDLAKELMENTSCYAYTPLMEIEVEKATQTIDGNQNYAHNIKGVDFGIALRPQSELVIDQDVAHIKLTLADGQELFNVEYGGKAENLQWIPRTSIKNAKDWKNLLQGLGLLNDKYKDVYDKQELINIIMDTELMNGAQLEITYDITVTNNGEANSGTTKAKNILNYVANNLNFDAEDERNKGLWEVVSVKDIQKAEKSTLVNNAKVGEDPVVDLSTQSVILKATKNNPLTTTSLAPGQSVSTQLVLKKVLSAENTASGDDLRYTNMAEIVEIDNEVGRYDHGAIPGNQKLELQPQEHDTAGASRYTTFTDDANINETRPQDGTIVITPPTGSNHSYYAYIIIGITSAAILALGVFLIKKFVISKE